MWLAVLACQPDDAISLGSIVVDSIGGRKVATTFYTYTGLLRTTTAITRTHQHTP